MELNEFYEKVGGNYEAVIQRLPSAKLIQKFVCKFPEDPSYGLLTEALAAGDFESAFRAAHTIKGTAANLGLDMLANAASELTEALRDTQQLADKSLIAAMAEAYQITIELIAELQVNG